MKKSIADQRLEYTLKKLDEKDVDPDPLCQFKHWFEEYSKLNDELSNAMILSTTDLECKPTSRVVLLKGLVRNGFVFHTNYLSRKGKNLTANPFASLLFFWPEMERQIRIEGKVEKLSPASSTEYFKTRPRESQLSALASAQSEIIPDRLTLEKKYDEISLHYAGKNIPRPENWGGYRLIPDHFEFWQGRTNRMHDRIVYIREKKRWIIRRLSP